MRPGDLKQAFARGVAWNLLQNLIGRVLGLVVVAILGRLLDRSAFGAIALAQSVVMLAELVMSQGFGEFIAQRANLTRHHLDTAFWINAGLGAALAMAVAIAADPFAVAFDAPELKSIIRWLSLALIIRSLSVVPTGLLVRQMNFRVLSVRNMLSAVLGGVAGIALALSGAGIYSLVAQLLIVEVVSVVALWGANEWRPGLQISLSSVKEMAAFGTPLFVATLFGFISRRLDTVVIGGALGLGLLGTYTIAQRMFHIANQVINKSADAVAFSALAKLGGAVDRRREVFYGVLEATAVVCFPLYVGLALVADHVVLIVVGPRWTPSADVLGVFAFAGVPVSLSYLHASALKAVGRTRSFLLVHIVLAAVYLPLLILLVDLGPSAAATAYLVGAIAIVPLEIWLVCSGLKLPVADYAKRLIGPMLATLVMSLVTLCVGWAVADRTVIVALLAQVAAAGLSFTVTLRLVAPTTFVRCYNSFRIVLQRRQRDLK